MKKRALVSVSDKTGIVEFCKRLIACDFEIISTGGTAKALKDAGLPVIGISELTGFPECLDGRVKTLHPIVHAGLLAMRSNPEHMEQLEKLNINTIDVVAVNLYPFKATISKPGVSFADAVENIDIGGPTMIRAAAKNYQDVAVVVDPKDYERVLSELEAGEITLDTKKYLQYKVFAHTAVYDSMISNYLAEQLDIRYPDSITFAYEKAQDMRYGENPHQGASYYSEEFVRAGSLSKAKQLWGKELSYNNINDANGALELVKEFDQPCVVASKHANPCGVGVGETVHEAYIKAYERGAGYFNDEEKYSPFGASRYSRKKRKERVRYEKSVRRLTYSRLRRNAFQRRERESSNRPCADGRRNGGVAFQLESGKIYEIERNRNRFKR